MGTGRRVPSPSSLSGVYTGGPGLGVYILWDVAWAIPQCGAGPMLGRRRRAQLGRSRSAGPAQLCSGLHGYGATRVQLDGTTLRCQPNAVYCAKGAARTRPRRGAALELSRLVWCGCAGRCRRAVAGRVVRRVQRGPNRRRRRGPQATARLGYQAVVMWRRTLSTAASGGANQDGSVPSRGTSAAWSLRLMSAISCTSVTPG